MLRSVAVARINQGIGFRASGNSLETAIVSMLQEAQRNLEKGKTLPRFLLQEDQTLTLLSGAHTAALPTGFLRESDEVSLHYYPISSVRPIFLKRRYHGDALMATTQTLEGSPLPEEPSPPRVFSIRRTVVDFIVTADQDYDFLWDYYKAAALLTSDIENEWLAGAPEWLIGEAGYRISADLRDGDAVTKFDQMRKEGRAACFGEDITAELASGPLRDGGQPMSLESATFIDDLDTSNPVSGDTKSQGDDHLRLIKTVLKNSIKRVTRVFYVPGTVAKSANYTVLAADDNKTIVCDTTAAFTLTLPALVASDAGWCVYVLKTTSDANPVWLVPPSGTINGHTKVRRSVASYITKVLWTGSVFVASRDNGNPVAALIPFYGTVLPQGHLWPDGTTFTAADFVELNTALGGNTKPDIRGRVIACKDDVGGVSANRLTSPINGDTLGAAGGTESHTLTLAESPPHDHGGVTSAETVNMTVSFGTTDGVGGVNFSALTSLQADATLANDRVFADHFHNITSAGGGGAHNNVQPTIIASYVIVAE